MNHNITVNIPILSILGIIFIVLKLAGTITWSWWWVLAPFWIPIAFLLAIATVIGIIVLIGIVLD